MTQPTSARLSIAEIEEMERQFPEQRTWTRDEIRQSLILCSMAQSSLTAEREALEVAAKVCEHIAAAMDAKADAHKMQNMDLANFFRGKATVARDCAKAIRALTPSAPVESSDPIGDAQYADVVAKFRHGWERRKGPRRIDYTGSVNYLQNINTKGRRLAQQDRRTSGESAREEQSSGLNGDVPSVSPVLASNSAYSDTVMGRRDGQNQRPSPGSAHWRHDRRCQDEGHQNAAQQGMEVASPLTASIDSRSGRPVSGSEHGSNPGHSPAGAAPDSAEGLLRDLRSEFGTTEQNMHIPQLYYLLKRIDAHLRREPR